ncbi:hypothetical protein AWB90_07145 [Mycobacterium paraense]|uniref:Uncharacterized protein n=1 Tax=Mycobacterium paraense TaxID=767916 RepID=A0A1X2AG50_9MYCO|nr:hypothetical protein AWB90_07145 [Mycobacterium paraense]
MMLAGQHGEWHQGRRTGDDGLDGLTESSIRCWRRYLVVHSYRSRSFHHAFSRDIIQRAFLRTRTSGRGARTRVGMP